MKPRSWQARAWPLIAAVAIAGLGPLLSPWSERAIDWQHPLAAPGLAAGHWFGTDRLGRDLFVRTLAGLRVSLLVALITTASSVTLGLAFGLTAGYCGGRIERCMLRLLDVFYAVPYVFVVILVTVALDRHPGSLFVSIAAIGWLGPARVVCAEARRLRAAPFIEAAIVIGLPPRLILWRHLLPNLLGPVLVYAALTVPSMILFESFLSFLGLGIQEPRASLGNLLSEGAREMEAAPWLLLTPGTTMTALVAWMISAGEGLRDRWGHGHD
jgi:oligopeptide transport system permease protein